MEQAETVIRPQLHLELQTWAVAVAVGMNQGRRRAEGTAEVTNTGPTTAQTGHRYRACFLNLLRGVNKDLAPSTRGPTAK